MYPFHLTMLTVVLRLLGYFSNLTITSRHATFRQAHTLSLSPSTSPVAPHPASTRTAVGTTITVKDLFFNHPVRQATSRSNSHAEWTELKRITLGIGLSLPVAVTLRNQSGEKVIRIDRTEGEGWERNVLEKSLGGKFCMFGEFEGNSDDVGISVKLFFASIPMSYTLTCKIPYLEWHC